MKPLTPEIEYCRATVKSWEKLRLLYNLILLVPGILVLTRTISIADKLPAQPIGTQPLELFAAAIAFGFCANICYCVGPYVEFVIAAFGFPITGQRSRYLIFGLGTMLSIAVIGLVWVYVELSAVTMVLPTPAP